MQIPIDVIDNLFMKKKYECCAHCNAHAHRMVIRHQKYICPDSICSLPVKNCWKFVQKYLY